MIQFKIEKLNYDLNIYNIDISIMDQTNIQSSKKYNLRSKKDKKDKSHNKHKNNMNDNLKYGCSSDDDQIISDIEYDSDCDDEANEIDVLEYRKLLSNLFPSKHMDKTMKQQNKVKEIVQNDSSKPQNSKEDNLSSSETQRDENTSDSEYGEDLDSDDSDYDSDYDDEFNGKNPFNFNILFTIEDKNNDESDSDDESDDDYSDNNETTITDEEDNNDDTESIKQEDKKESKRTTKKKQKNKVKDVLNEVSSETKSKSNSEKNVSSNPHKKSVKKKNKSKKKSQDKSEDESQDNEDNDKERDEKATKAFREVLGLFKEKKSNTSQKVFDKFEKLLEEEEDKLKKKKMKEDKIKSSKNAKKFKKLLYEKNKQNEIKYFKSVSFEEQESLIKKMVDINHHTKISKPYKVSLIESDIPVSYKASAIKKINSLNYMDQGSGEYYKIKEWVDTFMKIPFGKYCNLPITIDDGIDKCSKFMEDAKDTLNDAVYGLDDAKLQILQMMGQWISNPNAVGSAIAIKGPMGTGKTTLVKDGISKILNRPFAFIALGGATDSSFLEGHSYTYEGSVWGKIVDIIIQSKCMNPVIYFDELDKVSDTAKGEEIIGILTHLTDTTQNSQFHDKYFSGIDFDLSKCLFIFSYNDESKVNPILRDRMYRIETEGYNGEQKNIISRDYLIPTIEKNVNFKKEDIHITDKAIEYMVRDYTDGEKGVRNLKRCIEIIYTKLNMFRLMKPNTKLFNGVETFEVNFPFTVDDTIVDKLIKKKTGVKKYNSMYI